MLIKDKGCDQALLKTCSPSAPAIAAATYVQRLKRNQRKKQSSTAMVAVCIGLPPGLAITLYCLSGELAKQYSEKSLLIYSIRIGTRVELEPSHSLGL
jgi:hypothetical protein